MLNPKNIYFGEKTNLRGNKFVVVKSILSSILCKISVNIYQNDLVAKFRLRAIFSRNSVFVQITH